MIPDRFNPRVWLRNWLLKPTAAELAARQSFLDRPVVNNAFTVVMDSQARMHEAFSKKISEWVTKEMQPGGVLHRAGDHP